MSLHLIPPGTKPDEVLPHLVEGMAEAESPEKVDTLLHDAGECYWDSTIPWGTVFYAVLQAAKGSACE